MSAALGVGAPSYASGAQRWNGTAAILNPKPMTVMTIAAASAGSSPLPFSAAAIGLNSIEPVKP